MDGREHAHAHPAAHAQRDVLQSRGHERGLFQRPAQGRHHLENHLGRRRGAVLHHQHLAGGFPRTVPHHRLYGHDGRHLVGAGTLLGAFPARRGTDHRQHRQAPAPSRTHKPAAHGRTGLDTRRIALGHQGHQELQCHGLRQAEVLRPERRPGAADPFDGPPPAAGFADERIPGHLGRRRHPGIRRFARIQGRAQPRRLHRLHRHVLADNAPGAHVHRPVLQHQPGYRRRRTHLLDHRRPERNPGQARGDRTRRAERQDRIPGHPLLVRRQPRGDSRSSAARPWPW